MNKLAWLLLGLLLSNSAFAGGLPQCGSGKATDSVADIRATLGGKPWFEKGQLIEDEPYKGLRGQVRFVTSGKTLKITTKVNIPIVGIKTITASAKICQLGKGVYRASMSSSWGGANATIREVKPNQVELTGAPGLNNTYSAQ